MSLESEVLLDHEFFYPVQCQGILGWVAGVSSFIWSSGKGVSGYWVRRQGCQVLFGQVAKVSVGIGSGGKGSKSGENLGLSQNFMYFETCILSCVQGSGFQSLLPGRTPGLKVSFFSSFFSSPFHVP